MAVGHLRPLRELDVIFLPFSAGGTGTGAAAVELAAATASLALGPTRKAMDGHGAPAAAGRRPGEPEQVEHRAWEVVAKRRVQHPVDGDARPRAVHE
jgi:hypothetical protein